MQFRKNETIEPGRVSRREPSARLSDRGSGRQDDTARGPSEFDASGNERVRSVRASEEEVNGEQGCERIGSDGVSGIVS